MRALTSLVSRLVLLSVLFLQPGIARAQLSVSPSFTSWLGWPSLGSLEAESFSGWAVAVGDFNCDGLGDLAMGNLGADVFVPTLFLVPDAGSATIIYGAASGQNPTAQTLTRLTFGEVPEDGDAFGYALAAGDFDGDDCDDLVIGVPRANVPDGGAGIENAGMVLLARGSAGGLSNGLVLHQDIFGVQESAEVEDQFGLTLAVGDLNNDGLDDLAVGVPLEELSGVDIAGVVHVFFGHAVLGLPTANSVLFHRGLDSVPGVLGVEEGFGAALAIGASGAEQVASLFVTAPRALVAGQLAGSVLRISNLESPDASEVIEYHQGTSGVPGTPEFFDYFGMSVAVGDFDGNGEIDIAVGIGSDSGSLSGAINVIYFGADRPPHQLWTRDDLPGFASEDSDNFSSALTVGDFNSDGIDDLAVSAVEREPGVPGSEGFVHVIYGSRFNGLATASAQALSLNAPGTNDLFGFALAAGPFGSGSSDDLVIGAPTREFQGFLAAGTALVYDGLADLFADGFESGDLSRW